MGQAVAYESAAKRAVLSEEIRRMDRQAGRMDSEVSAGLIDSQSFSHDRLNDKAGFLSRLKAKKRQLALITPPSVEELEAKGVKESDLRERSKQLAKFIVGPYGKFPRMRSRIEMDQCPAGAADLNNLYHRKIAHHNVAKDGTMVSVDHAKGQYPAYVEFKNLCRILGKDSEAELDSSLANLELLRPDDIKDNDSLMNFRTRTFASPASRLSAQEFEDRVGIEHLNPSQLALHELEKRGSIVPPTMQEHFTRMFGEGDNKESESAENIAEPTSQSAAASTIGEPLHIGDNKWALPDGVVLEGTREEVFEMWSASLRESKAGIEEE